MNPKGASENKQEGNIKSQEKKNSSNVKNTEQKKASSANESKDTDKRAGTQSEGKIEDKHVGPPQENPHEEYRGKTYHDERKKVGGDTGSQNKFVGISYQNLRPSIALNFPQNSNNLSIVRALIKLIGRTI